MKDIRHESIRKILIRAVNWVGDAVMTTPAIGVIREVFPQAEITILANPLVAQIFTPHEWVDRVITFDQKGLHRGILGRFRLASELRKHSYDLAVILPNSFNAALVPWLAGVPLRLGKSSDGRGFMLSHRYIPAEHPPVGHEVEYYLNLLRHFGISGQPAKPYLCILPEEEQQAQELLSLHGIAQDEFVIGINPGATYGSAKRWYPDRFAEVARRLAAEWSARILIFGGHGETEMAADIEKHLDQSTCLNLAGKTTIRELMALIRRCNFFITNDSGPMHLAAALDVPVTAIFGSTDHTGTSPYSDKAVVVRKDTDCAPCKLRECPTDHRCMTSVTVEDVMAAARQLHHECLKRT